MKTIPWSRVGIIFGATLLGLALYEYVLQWLLLPPESNQTEEG